MINYPYINIDDNGCLIPLTSMNKVSQTDIESVCEITNKLYKVLGDNLRSVILRGSVACGMPIRGISDLDMIIFPYEYSSVQRDYVESLARELLPNYSSKYSLIDLSYVDYNELSRPETNNRMIMNITLSGVTVFGEDIISKLPPLRLDRSLATKISSQTIRETTENLTIMGSDMEQYSYMGIKRDVKFLCIWMMRVICRGLIAPVMIQKPVFTLNVEVSCKEYLGLYPEHTLYVNKMLLWEREPISDKDEIMEHINDFMNRFKDVCHICKIQP